jgi:hypothetical protein
MAKTNSKLRKQQRRQEQARQHGMAATPAEREPVDDRRSITVDVQAIDGVQVDEPHVAVVIEPVRLLSGEDLWFQTPFVVPFYLLKSKELRDVGEPLRKTALTETTANHEDGSLRPNDPFGVLDALENLALAVILAAAAIEAHANDMIGRLPDDAMVEIPTRVGGVTVPVMRNKTAMEWLPTGDKLARAAPLLHGTQSIKGTVPWQHYKRLFRLRNALVHQRREAVNDPLKPSAFGKLLLGGGSSAPEDAAGVIEALEPRWIPENIRPELGLS